MMKNETSNFQIGRFLIEQRSFYCVDYSYRDCING